MIVVSKQTCLIGVRHTIVPSKSIKTKNRIEKQQKPNSSGNITSSHRLWTVELIHRRRCENKTRHDSGAIVCATACGQNLVLNVGKCFINSVVKKRSSPSEKRFFLWRVSTLGSAYSSIIRVEMIIGRPLSAVRTRYRLKHPGKQVTDPKRLSKALER